MFRRAISLFLLLWALGFLWFAVLLPRPAGDEKADAVVVLTGSPGRIVRGLAVLRAKQAPVMLVSGVSRDVRPEDFAREYKVPDGMMRCCVRLGYEAIDTRTNAEEVAHWIAANHPGSIRLVTSDWHMRRAELELAWVMREGARPKGVTVVTDAVPTHPHFSVLFLEYHKLLAAIARHGVEWLLGLSGQQG